MRIPFQDTRSGYDRRWTDWVQRKRIMFNDIGTMAIDEMIVKCAKKQCLKDSRSYQLRCCAKKAGSKAEFLEGHRDRLAEEMMAEKLPLKTYRIERFVNARFSYHTYPKR